MQIITDESKKELKAHGTHQFPLLVSYEKISAYEAGSFIWHWHPEIELTLITSGEMLYRINHQEYHVHQGDALFSNANALHAGTMYQHQECTYTSITFDPKLIFGFEGSMLHDKYVYPLLNDLSLSSLCLDHSDPWHEQIIHSIQSISDQYDKRMDMFEINILIELYNILKVMHANINRSKDISSYDRLNYDRIRTILVYIENNYDKPLTLDEIATQVHICKNECCRIFKSYMRQPLFDFITEYRIEKSIILLMEGRNTISEIALMSGFNDSNYFSRVFKKQKGCSPSQYRMKIAKHG